jgi:hypothetical protein
MPKTRFYLTVCFLAALAPLLPLHSNHRADSSREDFPGWPEQFEGRALQSLPLSIREERYSADFPGRIARFTDGEREVIIRWVTMPTRQLHPASDCFRGIGYDVEHISVLTDRDARHWSRFVATRGEERLVVRERIYNNFGQSWPDVSSWYWSAVRGQSRGPWWAITAAEKRRDDAH